MKKVTLSELKGKNICGIYKIDFPDGKSYIGQSHNIYARLRDHNQRARLGHHGDKKIQYCEQIMHDLNFQIEDFILLEETSIQNLDAREQYWIEYYNTKNEGYNITIGGDVSYKRGLDHINASFTQDNLNELIQDLKDGKLNYLELAQKYNVCSETIRRINNGESYYNENIEYPIREKNYKGFNKKTELDYFQSIDQLLQLKEDLLYRWDLTLTNLALQYKIPIKIIYSINQGDLYNQYGQYKYPIRAKNHRNNFNFTPEIVSNILKDLKETQLSMSDIGDKYNIGRRAVSSINNGSTYPIKDYKYPAR